MFAAFVNVSLINFFSAMRPSSTANDGASSLPNIVRVMLPVGKAGGAESAAMPPASNEAGSASATSAAIRTSDDFS